jgi:hypothetical protein
VKESTGAVKASRAGLRSGMAAPGNWEEFTGSELSYVLAETRWEADSMLDLAHCLATKLPKTYAAFRTGALRQSKVEIIARAVAALDPEEARKPINLTIPLATLLGLAERPGELAALGPVEPDPEANTSGRYRTLTRASGVP